ncbi:LacI family DNA-binding transcriptional regulator [Chitinophaga qingshengii]|uniref:LacI family DNA-binding transcriptional regulator n=1 Tax=Chitinophaga qingshengii TaxID=1569794 RepID=A0ABR7TIQ7_9BACT|nr:LacI family DNA-binding transcriptional regulator [Chitinophaga qingshengii]MBC9929396.1 LacI family DNA-binding transcriptional regulator [Chitinophaga qingshengii]
MQRFITIRDIARELNISVATVSRAMRDTYDVSRKTREKVLEKAVQMNYKPNFNAIGLAQRNTRNIGVILPAITHYYFAAVINGIQEVAYQEHFNIVLYVTNDSAQREREIIRNLSLTSFDGLLVSISSPSDACQHFEEIIHKGLPVVFFDRVPGDIVSSKVVQDDFNGAFEAVEHLIRNGYSRIAHITGPENLELTAKRRAGYMAALSRYDIPFEETLVVHSGFTQHCGEQDMYRLLQAAIPPDAVFAVNDRKALGAMVALKNKKIGIGSEIGIVGFTNDPACDLVSPSLTTMAEPAFEIGTTSCELLLKHIRKKYFQPREITLPGTLIKRASSIR